jgi:hypothetical protein
MSVSLTPSDGVGSAGTNFSFTATVTDATGVESVGVLYTSPIGGHVTPFYCNHSELLDGGTQMVCSKSLEAGPEQAPFHVSGTFPFYSVYATDSLGNQSYWYSNGTVGGIVGQTTHNLNLPDIVLSGIE